MEGKGGPWHPVVRRIGIARIDAKVALVEVTKLFLVRIVGNLRAAATCQPRSSAQKEGRCALFAA